MKRAPLTILGQCLVLSCLTSFLLPVTAQAWWNPDWTLRKKITIDTSANGVPITDPIGTAVVLVRLSDYQFSAGKDDGTDIRFIADDDKTPLTYHIEKFDSLMGEALLWVKVPDLKPGATTDFWLYYGNAAGTKPAPGGNDAKGTYDSDTALVYHFNDPSGTAPQDATGNANNAQNAGVPDDGGMIGQGLRLAGKTPITIPPSTSLKWSDGQSLTWSAWVNPAALQPNQIIFSRHDGTSDFLVGCDSGTFFVEVNGTRSQGGTPVQAKTWHHVAVVADGGKITLFVDGAAGASMSAPIPALGGASLIGADAPDATAGNAAFAGEMDELEISNVARTPGVIRLAAVGQAQDTASKLLAIGTDEQLPASWLSGTFGLFGVILRSVTVDGWVVIGILGIMAIVSWYVMITKFFYVNFVQSGNKLFLKEWKTLALDLTALDHSTTGQATALGAGAGPKVQRMIRKSPLYRIYHNGSDEISKRISNGRFLSSRSIQAIRASLDSSYVHENHALNDGLVFLTISIAGGPFMGLLGTVVGVMITFAAIAATGEVNISAIAPGLAAALVATVAGLLVAIPALLGYNYLMARLKTVTSDLQVFIDEFVTKMAEFYGDSSDQSAVDFTRAADVDSPVKAEQEPVAPLSPAPAVMPVATPNLALVTPPAAIPVAAPNVPLVTVPATKPVAPPTAIPVAAPNVPLVTPPASKPVAPPAAIPVAAPSVALVTPPAGKPVTPPAEIPVASANEGLIIPPKAKPVAPPAAPLIPVPPRAETPAPAATSPSEAVIAALPPPSSPRKTRPIPPPANSKLGPVAPITSRLGVP